MRINGRRVGDHLLDPGWTAYRHRLLVATHDVTDLLTGGRQRARRRPGRRLVPRPDRLGPRGRPRPVRAAARAAGPAGGRAARRRARSSWRRTRAGARRPARSGRPTTTTAARSTCGSARHGWDRPGFDDSSLVAGGRRPARPGRPGAAGGTARPGRRDAAPADRCSARTPTGRRCSTPARTWPASSGSPSGAEAGDTVTVRHAEVLEPDGSAAHPVAAHGQGHRHATSSPTTTTVTLEPSFTFHGFRYAEVVTRRGGRLRRGARHQQRHPGPRDASAAPTPTSPGSTRTSGGRSGTTSSPCRPTARSATSGSAGPATPRRSRPTACTLFDARAFWASWLVDLALDQTADGGVPSVVPNILGDGELALGRAGWADAATIVPWSVHVAYGDREVLARQLPSMKAHVGYLQAQAPRRRPARRRVPVRRLARPGRAARTGARGQGRRPTTWPTRSSPTAPAWSPAPAACSATRRGPRYADLADEVARLTWDRWREHATTTQTGAAVAARARHRAGGGARADRRTRWPAGPGRRRAHRHRLPRHPAGAAGAHPHRPPRRGVPDAAAPRAALLALPGDPRGDDGVGALGRDPRRRLHPRRPAGAARPRERDALLQPLRLRRGRRLGLPARRRDRAGRRGAGLPARDPRAEAGGRDRLRDRLGRDRARHGGGGVVHRRRRPLLGPLRASRSA